MDAGLVIKVSLIERPSIPLSAYADPSFFKLYYSDIGLLGAMARVPSSSLISDDERYREFKGGMTENYVLTELTAYAGGPLFYWRSGNKAEVDFVHLIKDVIVPIEVKSGSPKRMQSMERYIQEYGPEKAFVVSERNVSAGKLTFVPLPLVWDIERRI
jgi:predicted AAA+ superfamily ATPase